MSTPRSETSAPRSEKLDTALFDELNTIRFQCGEKLLSAQDMKRDIQTLRSKPIPGYGYNECKFEKQFSVKLNQLIEAYKQQYNDISKWVDLEYNTMLLRGSDDFRTPSPPTEPVPLPPPPNLSLIHISEPTRPY